MELDLSDYQGRVPIELDGHSVFPPIGQLTYLLTLPPFGFYWFLLSEAADWPSTHTPAPEPMPEYQTIIMRRDLAEALLAARYSVGARNPAALSGEAPLVRDEGPGPATSRIALITRLPTTRSLLEIETETASGYRPLAAAAGHRVGGWPAPPLPTQLALARIRRGPRVGLLTDAFALPSLLVVS